MAGPIEQHFAQELQLGTERLKREISYNPTYFNRMVAELGPVEACCKLIRARGASDGFTKLWEHQRMDMTVEALALLPWYESLFDIQDRESARHRLGEYGFDVDEFVASRAASPPTWWDATS